MAKPVLTGRNARLTRRNDGTINSADLVVQAPSSSVHEFTGLPLDANGWHDLDAILMADGKYLDARFIYVDSVGGSASPSVLFYTKDDGRFNSVIGDTPTNPIGTPSAFSTLSAAKAYMRRGYPDCIFLKRGGSYSGGLNKGSMHSRATDEPSMLTAYGTGDMPIHVGTISCSFTNTDAPEFNYLSDPNSFFFLSHLDIRPSKIYDPDDPGYVQEEVTSNFNAFTSICLGTDIFVEGIISHYGAVQLNWPHYSKNPTYATRRMLRRSALWEMYSAKDALGKQAISGGLVHTINVQDVLIEESTFWRGGWLGPNYTTIVSRTAFDHCLYLSFNAPNTAVKNCIIAEPNAWGCQMRYGGTFFNNFLYNCKYGGQTAGGPVSEVSYNVFEQMPPKAEAGSETGWVSNPGWYWDKGFNYTSFFHHNHHNIFQNKPADADPNGEGLLIGTGQKIAGNVSEWVVHDNIYYNYQTTKGQIRLTFGSTDVDSKTSNIYNNKHTTLGATDIAVQANSSNNADNGDLTMTGSIYELFDATGFSINGTAKTLAEWSSYCGDTGTTGTHGYPDPGRTITDYMAYIGETGGWDEFIATALAMNKNNWDERFTAASVNSYIRAGYGMSDPA